MWMTEKPGSPGKSYYTWIKFADDGLGNGMSDYPDGKQYMGIAYNKGTLEESNNARDYQWARITGEGDTGTHLETMALPIIHG